MQETDCKQRNDGQQGRESRQFMYCPTINTTSIQCNVNVRGKLGWGEGKALKSVTCSGSRSGVDSSVLLYPLSTRVCVELKWRDACKTEDITLLDPIQIPVEHYVILSDDLLMSLVSIWD